MSALNNANEGSSRGWPSPALDSSLQGLLPERTALLTLARRLVHDRDRAEDVVQDAWMAALIQPPEDPARARGWLRGVVRNVACMTRRSDARRSARERHVATEPMVTGCPARSAEAAETQRWLARLLLKLEEPFRTTLLLRFLAGMPTDEIAEQTGVPRNTVRSRLKRGLDRLRAAAMY